MPYKDPHSPAAIASLLRRSRKYEASHKQERKIKKLCAYWNNPEAERKRHRERKHQRLTDGKCSNCGRPHDRGSKCLCSICAPKFAKSAKAHQRRIKEAVFNAYGGPVCACCGETIFEFLTIDHIDGGGTEHRKQLRNGDGYSGGGGYRTYRWLKKHNYPPGFRVLCMNCNFAIGMYGACPHNPEFHKEDSPSLRLVQ